MKMLRVALALLTGTATSLPPPPSCEHLQHAFGARGVARHEVPKTPVSGSQLSVCHTETSCCTRAVEQRLGAWAERRYRDELKNKTTDLLAELDTRATQVDGVMYQKNAEVFQEYFEDLKMYYDKGNLNPADSTASFFTSLYQRMFKVLNTQYTFDGLYLSCVAENIDQLRPFGDVPRKMATSIKRSLVAARALVKALRSGHEIVEQMLKVEPSPSCLSAVKSMRTCPACQGLPTIPPCNGFCLNVMKGCLAHHYHIDDLWARFIDSLTSLSERLVGPFNVEMTVEPISIKISDAIMNFQESGFQVTQKVFELCGTPRLGRRQAGIEGSPFVFEKRLEKSHRPSSRPTKSDFEKLLIDLKKKLKEFSGFWRQVPYKMCDNPPEEEEKANKHLLDKESCWNGVDAASYQEKVVEDNAASQLDNPEVVVLDGEGQSHTVLSEQKFKLQSLTNVLKSAYRGQDIEWWDDEEDSSEVREGSGGAFYNDYVDDEDGFGSGGDDEDSIGGSGERENDDDEEEEDAIIVPSWTASKDEDTISFKEEEEDEWNPWPKFTDSKTSTPRPLTTGGTSSVHLKSRWAVVRAVATYTLPMVTCYFGGFLTDTPWLLQ